MTLILSKQYLHHERTKPNFTFLQSPSHQRTIATCPKNQFHDLTKLPPACFNAVTHLITLLNRILIAASLPSSWRIALVIPLLKPLKNPSHPSSYQPIYRTPHLPPLTSFFAHCNNVLSLNIDHLFECP